MVLRNYAFQHPRGFLWKKTVRNGFTLLSTYVIIVTFSYKPHIFAPTLVSFVPVFVFACDQAFSVFAPSLFINNGFYKTVP